jgi:hypothetical protein
MALNAADLVLTPLTGAGGPRMCADARDIPAGNGIPLNHQIARAGRTGFLLDFVDVAVRR